MPSSGAPSALPLPAAPMDHSGAPNPFAAVTSFIHHHLSRLAAAPNPFADVGRHLHRIAAAAPVFPAFVPFAAAAPARAEVLTADTRQVGRHAFDLALSPEYVAKTLTGTAVYTVSNSNNEFVLVSDPNDGLRSLGILCFRREDAQSLLAQVQLRQPNLGKGARVVPITLDQDIVNSHAQEAYKDPMQTVYFSVFAFGNRSLTIVNEIFGSNLVINLIISTKDQFKLFLAVVYMLKVEGIAFRFLPDPLQIKNALALKSGDASRGFDGVPVFQSDLLVIKKKNKRYCPIYFQKEDIERELYKISKPSRGSGFSQNIMVGSLEDVLKKMEMNDKNSGWDDLIFIPPGKTYTEHIKEVAA